MNKKKLAKAVFKGVFMGAKKLLKGVKKLKAFKKTRRAVKRTRKSILLGAVQMLFGRLFAILAAVYAVLFAVFFFDLDGKLMYYVVEPFLVKHYDKMERRNPLDMPYEMK